MENTVDQNYQQDWDLSHWQYLYGKPESEATFKAKPQDFVVTENLAFEPTGEGEHLFLLIEKIQLNTQQVCEHLAKFFDKRLRDIGYAGMKDKQSVSRQWFSVQMNVLQQPELSNISTDNIHLVKTIRHNKKLKVGALTSNHFDIRLSDVSDIDDLTQKLELAKTGVPNYFGLQRFGFKGNNLNWANRMADGEVIKNKKIKGFALSASRSYLFNQVVSQRIKEGLFNTCKDGDVFMLSGSNSFFTESINDAIIKRLGEDDIQISAPLAGDGELASTHSILEIEQSTLLQHANWLTMLSEHGLKQERRSIKLKPENMHWQQDKQDVIVSFDLATGCFATSVLRECVIFRELDEQ